MLHRRVIPPSPPDDRLWPIWELGAAVALGLVISVAVARTATQAVDRYHVYARGAEFARRHPAPAAVCGLLWSTFDP